jgi:hypothetical protein
MGRGCHIMINLSRWRSPGRQKSMCLAATGWLQGRAAKLLRAHRKSRYSEDLGQICLAANSFIALGNLLVILIKCQYQCVNLKLKADRDKWE